MATMTTAAHRIGATALMAAGLALGTGAPAGANGTAPTTRVWLNNGEQAPRLEITQRRGDALYGLLSLPPTDSRPATTLIAAGRLVDGFAELGLHRLAGGLGDSRLARWGRLDVVFGGCAAEAALYRTHGQASQNRETGGRKSTDPIDRGPGASTDGQGSGTGKSSDTVERGPGASTDGKGSGSGKATDTIDRGPGASTDGQESGSGKATGDIDRGPGASTDGKESGSGKSTGDIDHGPGASTDGKGSGSGKATDTIDRGPGASTDGQESGSGKAGIGGAIRWYPNPSADSSDSAVEFLGALRLVAAGCTEDIR